MTHRIVLEGGPEDGRELDVTASSTIPPSIRVAVRTRPLDYTRPMTNQVPTDSVEYVLLIGPGGNPARSRSGAIRYQLNMSPPDDMTRHPRVT